MPTSRTVFLSTSSGQIVDPAGVQRCLDALGFLGLPWRFKALSPIDVVGLPRHNDLPSQSEVTRERQALVMQLYLMSLGFKPPRHQ